MSLITELVALASQLDASITDRKIRDLFLPLKEKILEVEREQFHLERKHAEEMDALTASKSEEVFALKSQILAMQNKQSQSIPADPCPFCNRPTGELQDMKKDRTFGHLGLQVGYYKCAKCGKTYSHQMQM